MKNNLNRKPKPRQPEQNQTRKTKTTEQADRGGVVKKWERGGTLSHNTTLGQTYVFFNFSHFPVSKSYLIGVLCKALRLIRLRNGLGGSRIGGIR